MAVKRRIPKKKLKEPDEFVTWGSKVTNYVLTHMGYIAVGALLVAALIAALFLWRQHQATSEEVAYALLGKGVALYHQDERREEALSAFSQLIKDYPRTKGGQVALLYRGRYYMLRQEYDLAVEDFQLSLKRSSQPLLRAIAFNALGNSYWAKGEYQRAIDYFRQVVDSGEGWLKPYSLLQIGMCWEKLGEKKKAVETYQESLKLLPPSPWGTLAKTRLKKLGGKIE